MVDKLTGEAVKVLRKAVGKLPKVDQELKGGMMNEAFIVSGGRKKGQRYVLYVPTAQANEMVDRKLERKIHQIAYKLGISNKNVYFNVKTGFKVNEFIEGYSINAKSEPEDFKNVAKLLLTYHSSKKMSGVYYDPLGRLENYRKEAETHTKEFDKEFYELWDLVMSHREFLLSQRRTLAHNDAQRSNIVRRASDDKYLLIDYEFAADNDPLYDIATFGNNDVQDGVKVLEEYEKLTVVTDGLKRYALWRIDVSLQWYLVAIIKHYRGEGAVHGFNFLDVAHNFLLNALEARKLLED